MPEATSRALFVALAREVATEVADLQSRGWEVKPPCESAGFKFRKTFPTRVDPAGLTVQVRELRNALRGTIRVQVEQQELDLSVHWEQLTARLGPEGYDELLRIHRLLTDRLN